MFNFNICLVDIFMHYLTDVFKVYIRLCFSRVNYMKHFSFVRVESYEKVSIFVILCLREFCQQVILFSFSLYCLEILMYFSSIWILTLPCLSLVRVKCPSNWSYFCFFYRCMYWIPVFSCIFSDFFWNCPALAFI